MLWGALSKRGGASNVVGEYMINGFSGCYLSEIVFRRADGPWEDDVHNEPGVCVTGLASVNGSSGQWSGSR